MKSKIFKVLFCGAVALLGFQTVSAQTVFYEHSFDGVANDSAPALQGIFNRLVGDLVPDLETGQLTYTFIQTGGFASSSPLDLSAETGFTIEFVVANNSAQVTPGLSNGAFFGLTSSATASATDDTALYNNAGGSTGPSIGLQVGAERGDEVASYVFDAMDGRGPFGTGTFTSVTPDNTFTVDATDGFTVCVTYEDALDGTTNVTIQTVGLATDIDFTINEAIAFSSFSNAVTPNVSIQGATLDLESITVTSPTEKSDVVKGDVDLSGTIDFFDIAPFITALSGGPFLAEADCDCNGEVNFFDIQPFVDILSGN